MPRFVVGGLLAAPLVLFAMIGLVLAAGAIRDHWSRGAVRPAPTWDMASPRTPRDQAPRPPAT